MMKKITWYMGLTMIFICCLPVSICFASQDGYELSRDTWLSILGSELAKSCSDLENSPFCFVKSQAACEQFMPVAAEECVNRYRYEIPERVTREDVNKWSPKLGRCIVEELITAAGGDNVDLNRTCN